MKLTRMLSIVAVALAAVAGSAVAQDLTRYELRVINDTNTPIRALYARNLTTDRLYSNLAPSGIVPNGVRTINLDDNTGACFWRLQADLADGREVRQNINVCSTTSWRVYD